MKTIGILTMHRVINYGSILQTYATQYIIERLGHKIIIIDYVFPNKQHVSSNKFSLIRSFLGKLYIINVIFSI